MKILSAIGHPLLGSLLGATPVVLFSMAAQGRGLYWAALVYGVSGLAGVTLGLIKLWGDANRACIDARSRSYR